MLLISNSVLDFGYKTIKLLKNSIQVLVILSNGKYNIIIG